MKLLLVLRGRRIAAPAEAVRLVRRLVRILILPQALILPLGLGLSLGLGLGLGLVLDLDLDLDQVLPLVLT